jgi:colanic acid/amylovoran biosynthesis glycosyltransferase
MSVMKIAYLIPEFPGLTHIIFWREIVRLREKPGVTVVIASTRRPAVPSPHAFADQPCFYAWPPQWGALRHLSLGRLWRQIRFALGLSEGGWKERVKVLCLIPSAWTMAAWVRREGVDHIHVHSFASALYLAALVHVACDVPYSAALHGGIDVYGLNHAAKLRHARFACVVSAPLRAAVEAVAPGKCLAALVPCGVDMSVFRGARRTPGAVLRLISVGRLNLAKGIDLMFEALAQLGERTDVHYTLVGGGPDEAVLRSHAERLSLSDKVTFLGAKGEQDVVRLLQAHDVAVLTSRGSFETTAIAIREAMATGMPVIMSRVGEAEGMIEPERTGILVDQGDVSQIVDAITWFSTHRHRIPAMGEAARAKALAVFSDTAGPEALYRAITAPG